MIEISTSQGRLFAALIMVWALSEFWLGWKRRSEDRSRMRDRGTLRLLLVTVYACIGVAVWFSYAAQGHINDAQLRQILSWTGPLLMAGGLALRFWAIRVLARFFTVDVAIREGHQLVRRGPYRLVRHPAYTGSLLTFLGFGLALGNGWSLLVVMLPVTVAFVWRMRVEEQVLAQAFPDEYPHYARHTWRLIPFVW